MFVMRLFHKTGIITNLSEDAPEVGDFLKFYDPDFADGRGIAQWTPNLEEALKFEHASDAMALWHAVPRYRPLRFDGRPNKPLTAYSIEIVSVEEAASHAESDRGTS